MNPRATQQPVLMVRARDGTHLRVPLGRQPITLGRADTCDVVLRNDGEVSREHAQVWLDERGQVVVRDCGSKNGTRVDGGDSFRDAAQSAAQTINIGEYEIEVQGARTSPASPEPNVRFVPDAPTQVGDTRFFPSSRGLDLNQQRLSLLMSLTERIGGAFERKQLLEQALDACCETLNFERGLIVLKTTRGDTELPVTRNVQKDETGAYKVSRTLINQALVHGERAVVNNPAVDLADNLTDSLVRFPICSALCVPIFHRDEILGVIYGDRITRGATYSTADVDFLAAIAQQVGIGLGNLQLFQQHVRAQKVYHELDRARLIQRRLLPARTLRAGKYLLAGYNQASSAVGGDCYDYFELDERRVAFTIADVTGHGLPAALLMANFQAAVRVALTPTIPLPELAERMNALVSQNTDSHVFITAILGRIDIETGMIEYVSAGHPGPVLISRRGVEAVEPDSSLPLGINRDEEFRTHCVEPTEACEAVLFYTDGLIEAAPPSGELLGLEAVLDALSGLKSATADMVLETSLQAARKHAGQNKMDDDLTLLVLQMQGG